MGDAGPPRHPEDAAVDVAFRLEARFAVEVPSVEWGDIDRYEIADPHPSALEVMIAAEELVRALKACASPDLPIDRALSEYSESRRRKIHQSSISSS